STCSPARRSSAPTTSTCSSRSAVTAHCCAARDSSRRAASPCSASTSATSASSRRSRHTSSRMRCRAAAAATTGWTSGSRMRRAWSVGPNRQQVAQYTADGIILATPTGSSAYSLSASGPVVHPSVVCILATPICPHTLVLRPLVLPDTVEITVEVLSTTGELILTVDGQDGADLRPQDRLVVRRGKATVPLVRFASQSFFNTLRRKLHWGLEHERGSRG